MTRLTYAYTDEHHLERARTLALRHGMAHIRRGAAAIQATRAGECDEHRLATTFDAHRRLILVLRELEMLA
jgi:hypothetical protein